MVLSIGWSAMMISAMTSRDTGRASVPISRRPRSMTIRLPTLTLVSAVVSKRRRPSTSMQSSFASLTTLYVTSWPAAILTLSFAPGTVPVDQVPGSDHTPLAALVTLGCAQKYGTPSGTPLTDGVWSWASCALAAGGQTAAAIVMTALVIATRPQPTRKTLVPATIGGALLDGSRW